MEINTLINILSQPGRNSDCWYSVNCIRSTNNINERSLLGVFKGGGAQRFGLCACVEGGRLPRRVSFSAPGNFSSPHSAGIELVLLVNFKSVISMYFRRREQDECHPQASWKTHRGGFEACFYPLFMNWENECLQSSGGRPNLELRGS